MSTHFGCPFFDCVFYFKDFNFFSSLFLYLRNSWQDFSHSVSFHSVVCFLHCAEVFKFESTPFVDSWHYFLCNWSVVQKVLAYDVSSGAVPVFIFQKVKYFSVKV